MLLQALVGDEEIAAFFSDAADLKAMLAFEVALAAAEAEAGLIPAEAAAAIEEGCRRFEPDWPGLAAGMAKDGVVGPAFVAALRRAVGEPHGRWVHHGATSQDVVDSSLVLRLKSVVAVLDGRIAFLIAALEDLQGTQGTVPLMAHTRMQRALPFTAADKVATWLRPLRRHRERLSEIGPRVLVLQLGGAVGTLDAMAGKGEMVAASAAGRLGLGSVPSWHTARDGIVELASWLALVAGSLGKIGQDVALMGQNEVGSVRIAGGGGSSAMPHKSNPVAAEILVSLARFAAGLSATLASSLVHENERSGAAWTLEWMVLPQLAVATGAALRHARALCRGLEFVASPRP
ncbi:MAG TPA: 3-carboxy-cis,cis-muconate cycloisomerase [Alphaproteobacteria bacterium]|nr:3-carboxy-cis,cis-muconate cycloisomerase [Alphaproteobacteria bacterium]